MVDQGNRHGRCSVLAPLLRVWMCAYFGDKHSLQVPRSTAGMLAVPSRQGLVEIPDAGCPSSTSTTLAMQIM